MGPPAGHTYLLVQYDAFQDLEFGGAMWSWASIPWLVRI